MTDPDDPIERIDAAIDASRRSRWADQPEGAERRYNARCAYWESLTARQVAGLDPMPTFEQWMTAERVSS